ncbi:MAG: glycosyltransferase family 4 protein [Verrucomicrobiae bacterium]|nr:glycosyltransferase family 4 protein [Verrucomicrobiae bacterium]
MNRPLRILWLKTGPLHPLDTGGKLRTYHLLRELNRLHEVTFLALCEPDTPPDIKQQAAAYCRRALWVWWSAPRKGSLEFYADLGRNLFSSLPYVLARYRSDNMRLEIQEEDTPEKHDLMVCDFLTPAINLFPLARGVPRPRLKVLLFQHNVEAQIWERLYQQQRHPWQRWYFHLQWQRLRRWEQRLCARSDGVVAVSETDAGRFRADYGLGNVLGSVPTGVDVEYFGQTRPHPVPGRIAFLGSMDWMPNVDAVEWWMKDIWPLVKQRHAGASFSIIGRNPPPAIAGLPQRESSVQVTGTVPDVRPHLGQAQVLVVPLRAGGGTRIKIYEAMAAGLPVVSTRVGAEGLPLRDGETIWLADTAEDFARAVTTLLKEPAQRERLAAAGQEWVRRHASWAQAASTLAGYAKQLIT